jgi:hypothetical protein
MQGNLRQIGLNDLLLLATNGKKSGVLKLARGKETVEVFFNSGVIVHASCPIGDGEKALLYPVTWTDGTFSLEPEGAPSTTTIQKSAAELLSEIESVTHEWKTILEVIPSSKAVFRLADMSDDQSTPITIPQVGWRVLCRLDGVRTIEEIADQLRIPFAYVAKVLFNLHKSGLVEAASAPAAEQVVKIVPQGLLNRMTSVLMEMIGPMAPLVLRDQMKALGASANNMPEHKLDDLIMLVGLEIPDSKLKKKFEETMAREIAEFKLS